jgi:hypothetical protein
MQYVVWFTTIHSTDTWFAEPLLHPPGNLRKALASLSHIRVLEILTAYLWQTLTSARMTV